MPFFVFDKVILAFQENNDTIFYVLLYTSTTRKDAGVVERAALEMRWAGNRSLGSNPSLSAWLLALCRNDTVGDLFILASLHTYSYKLFLHE